MRTHRGSKLLADILALVKDHVAGLEARHMSMLLAGALLLAAIGNAQARDLTEILQEKGIITTEEGHEASAGKGAAGDLRVYWKQGLRLDSKDKAFRLKIGGRIQNDWAVIAASNAAKRQFGLDDSQTGTEFRRARLYVAGKLYHDVEFKAQYDFAGGTTAFKDIYLGLENLPLISHVRVGHFKEPFSLEMLTSSKYATFMERGLPNDVAPSRNTGIAAYEKFAGGRVTWALGGFRETDGVGNGFGSDSKYNVTTRLTGLPWYEDGGARLLHVGLSYSHKFRNNDAIRFRQRPEAHLSPARFVDTQDITSDGVDLINPEAALVVGPFSLQGAYTQAFVNTPGGADPDFQGWYVYASYFLTGEHRPYKTSAAAFDRVHPKADFLHGKGRGAWEVAARYSHLDLDDAGVKGGKLDDVTAGLNWYLNPNLRFSANYVYADPDPSGVVHIGEARFQIDF